MTEIVDEIGSRLPWWPRLATERWLAAVRATRQAFRPRALWSLTGAARSGGGTLRVVTDLRGDGLAYWTALLFESPPTRTPLGADRLARRLAVARDADLALVTHHRAFRRTARRLGYLTAPAWLDTGLALGSTVDATLGALRWGHRSRQSDLRRIHRAALRPAVVRDAGEIRSFLRDWYLPYVSTRWGASYAGLDAAWMQRAVRYCELLWVLRGEEKVAGVLLEPQGSALRMVVLGMHDAADRRDGALAALYYFAIVEAVRRGQRLLRTGGTRPVLSDGVLEFKRKWGAGIRRGDQQDYLALAYREWSPAVASHFVHHPVVVETARDGFRALTDPAAASERSSRGMFEVLGLAGLIGPTDVTALRAAS